MIVIGHAVPFVVAKSSVSTPQGLAAQVFVVVEFAPYPVPEALHVLLKTTFPVCPAGQVPDDVATEFGVQRFAVHPDTVGLPVFVQEPHAPAGSEVVLHVLV